MMTQLYRERQLWGGNESVEIRYVNGSYVAGTSASSPGVPRHIQLCISTYTEAQEGLDLTAGDGDSGRAGEPSNHRYGYEVYQKTCNIELII